ncbi:YdcF family protein [Paraurantiacibacter namhicola]|uniref:DUF218 domain-containing protein n=1 Tax=Paraurantiacibacter namhicola TaxID=645517 RepID=A0A1C7D6H7_9SPHN|nr:YdcF family protein [Paraurantiacibacter namhicola]ANU07069.1 hypothetical protein A6F65_00749 [Paraurantiacibacter namhicola]
MIRRLFALLLVVWLGGFAWFAIALPTAAGATKTDIVVVPTGGGGRIDRGLDVVREGNAEQLLVSGVDRDVRRIEFQTEFDVEPELMECCVILGFRALDTRGNARETAEWVEEGEYESLRLVTSDWHMRRTAAELRRVLPAGVTVVEDAVETEPSLRILFLEYHKFLASALDQG